MSDSDKYGETQIIWGPYNLHGLTLISTWINNRIHYKMWDEIIYPLPKFNDVSVAAWEWISEHVITYSCWD